jgi:hypothetical protein
MQSNKFTLIVLLLDKKGTKTKCHVLSEERLNEMGAGHEHFSGV